jgi:osmotically-inducible protein OsmY
MDVREQAISLMIRSKLAEDTRTYGQMIDVYVTNGDIYLVGTCDSDIQRTIAAELVRGMPGVRQVIDNIIIRGIDSAAA